MTHQVTEWWGIYDAARVAVESGRPVVLTDFNAILLTDLLVIEMQANGVHLPTGTRLIRDCDGRTVYIRPAPATTPADAIRIAASGTVFIPHIPQQI